MFNTQRLKRAVTTLLALPVKETPSQMASNPTSLDERFTLQNSAKPRTLPEWCAIGLVTAGLLLIGYLTFHPWLLLHNSDGATFYILAVALSKGQGYELLSLPEPEWIFNFTPIWPMLLSGLMKLQGSYDPQVIVPSAKWLMLGLYIGIVGLFNKAIRPLMGSSMALALTFLLAINGVAHQYMGDLLADIPYMLFSLIAMGFFIRADRSESGTPSVLSRWAFPLALLFLGISVMARPVALALAGGACIAYLLRRQWKRLILTGLTFTLVFGSWSVAEHVYRSNQTVGDAAMQEFIEDAPVKLAFIKYFMVSKPEDEDTNKQTENVFGFVKSFAHRAEQYGVMTTKAFWPVDILNDNLKDTSFKPVAGAFKWVFLAITALLLGTGILRTWKKYPLVTTYPAVMMALLCSYPYISGRYILPIMPCLIFLFFTGLLHLLWRLQNTILTNQSQQQSGITALTLQRRTAAIATLVAIIALTVQLKDTSSEWIRQAYIQNSQQPFTNPMHRGIYDTLTYLNGLQHATPNDQKFLLITRKPEISYFYSGVNAIRFPFYEDKPRLLAWLKEQQEQYAQAYPGGIYILEDSAFKESRYMLSPMLAEYPSAFTPIYTAQDTVAQTPAARLWKLR